MQLRMFDGIVRILEKCEGCSGIEEKLDLTFGEVNYPTTKMS